MSATDQMRTMLDELMGTSRNGDEPRIEFDDPRVCKSFLMECCPHEILSGTRMDIGACRYIHDVALKSDYKRKSERRSYFYELEALSHLEDFVADCNRRTELAKSKLRETQEELSEEATEQSNHINKLGEEIGTKLAKAEALGVEGKVDESVKLMANVYELHKDKSKAEIDLRTAIPTSTYQQQKLRVCEACSAYLGVHDNDRRLADHFGGKLHLGFISIRSKLDDLRQLVKEKDLVRKHREDMLVRRKERHERSRDRDYDREREREHVRSRSRSSDHGKRKKQRSRSSRSRSRPSSNRSHSRKRDHHRNRGSSKEKKHRSHHDH